MLKSESASTITRCLATALAFSPAAGHADVVSEWNRIAIATVSAAESDGWRAARNVASVHIALFEAFNFVEGRFEPRYLVRAPQPGGMSAEATAAAAAHKVLVALYPRRRKALDVTLRDSYGPRPGRADHSAALRTGAELGNIVRVVRQSQELAARHRYRGETPLRTLAWSTRIEGAAICAGLNTAAHARLLALAGYAVDAASEDARRTLAEPGSEAPCISCSFNEAIEEMIDANRL